MVTAEGLKAELADAPDHDRKARSAVRSRIDDILRPTGALGRLDEIAVWLAGWQRTDRPAVDKPAAVIFAGDHGVTTEAVSAYPAEVTAAMLRAFEAGKASVSAMAGVAGATVHPIDVGVGRPTANLRVESAMSSTRFEECFAVGRQTIAELECDVLIVGEMGIGSTTAAACVSAAILGEDPDAFVGRGTGIDDSMLSNKTRVVADALQRIDGVSDPLEVVREVGGTEFAAMAGAMVEARIRSLPILLDGYIATAPALALYAADSGLVANARAGHRSAEPGHLRVLDHMGLDPLLELDMRLGEASGAMAAIPLLKMACRLVTEVPTFAEWFGTDG